MSTDAMRAALEALEAVQQWTEKRPATHPWDAWQLVGPAIDKVRAALAQPVSAERVPLTEEQIDEMHCDHVRIIGDQVVGLHQFARAIERAHGIGEPK